MDRSDGYVQEIDYTHGYSSELAPGLVELACVAAGVTTVLRNRPLRYLEMAFGQGVSIAIHAAACPGEYTGFDFNPAHATNARTLAAASGSGAELTAETFAEFVTRKNLSQFDIIALHGTWSWISAENRARVVDIVRRLLVPGGVFFVSYNCWPGWATELPLRHLMIQHAERSEGSLEQRIDAAMAFAQSLIEADAKFFKAHPGLEQWLADMRGRSRKYLAHEYFNRDWHPMPFSEVEGVLRAAGLGFVGSAKLSDRIEGFGLTAAGRALTRGVTDPVLRETTLDYLVNRRFRRDLFVNQPTALSPAAREDRLRAFSFTLLQLPAQIKLNEEVSCAPFIEAMADGGFAPKTLAQIERHGACAGVEFADLVKAALYLTSEGSLHPAQSREVIEQAAPRCAALNAAILERARRGEAIAALASPVTGAGVFMAQQELLFLGARAAGCTSAEDWARLAGETLTESDPEVLLSNARAFARIRMPVLQALRVA